MVDNIYVVFNFRRERKYFPVHKMSKRMSSTLGRIYKRKLQLTNLGYPSAPEHQSTNSENSPEVSLRDRLG